MTKTVNLELMRPRKWKHSATGLHVILPCDKRTFIILNPNDGYTPVTPIKFRTLKGAARFIASMEY